ncbi:sulfotransferase [uncultured Celeribacter sp.]|uniref:sulfotransferase n=1 Tax=uncultured Celeribacter sp. TaxID=1303376 RepID=UPI002AA904DC|nr:sulfotransferase [uncultured Celeribacter sp.]
MATQIVIVGYHRSGTSAMAQHCAEAGLFVGDDLLGAKASNPFGHFEDREAYDINQAIMQTNSATWDTTSDLAPVIPKKFYSVATDLISRRDAVHDVWGFKDPRTCLLLDFWHSVLPNPKYLVVLRHYTSCIDSVMRRVFKDYYSTLNTNVARNVARNAMSADAVCINWCIHMTGILQFLAQRNADAVVVRIDRLAAETSVAAHLNDRFGINLDPIPMSKTFRPELFQDTTVDELVIDPALRQTADQLWDKATQFLTLSDMRPTDASREVKAS